MLNVKRLRSEPFLWIHLFGVVIFPVFLAVTLIGLGIGDSYPFVLELLFLSVVGILPILAMQLVHPFNIFSVLFLSLKPECLSGDRRAILSLFKTWQQKLASFVAAGMMVVVLWLLYSLSPLAVGSIDFLPQLRILGLSIAGVAFLLSNLFWQIPMSVLLVLSTKQSKLTQAKSYPPAEIEPNFTTPGIRVSQILWFVELSPDMVTDAE